MLCSKLILNTSKINDKIEKIKLEILQMLQKIFSLVDQQIFSKVP